MTDCTDKEENSNSNFYINLTKDISESRGDQKSDITIPISNNWIKSRYFGTY